MDYADQNLQEILAQNLDTLQQWRSVTGSNSESKPDSSSKTELRQVEHVLQKLTNRLKGNYPFHAPSYAGQMLKPPHPVAWAAYQLASTINPNNHALDGGPPTSEMEKEAVAQLAQMVGYGDTFLGHLTGGGTMANLEALWVAANLHPDKAIAFSGNAHYTHRRMCELLNLEYIVVPSTPSGEWDMEYLNHRWNDIGSLVVTLGTTGLGSVEPLHHLLPEARKNSVRIHIDAAYGGYFKLISDQLDVFPWKMLHRADSIVIDPHKHGLQPYGCGCILFKNANVGQFYKHDSPYTYFTSEDLHLGEISLECSRPGAAAAALWATMKLLPLKPKEGMGPMLQKCHNAAMNLYDLLQQSSFYQPVLIPQLDIIAYYPFRAGEFTKTSRISEISKNIFQRGMEHPSATLYLSLYTISSAELKELNPKLEVDSEETVILRSVLMKPEHEPFIPELYERLRILAEEDGV